MSRSDIHKKKRRKNLVLLALIFAWCALIWVITMVKMARAEDLPQLPLACTMEAKQCPDGSYVSRTGPDCEFAPCPGGAAPPEKAEGADDRSLDDIFQDLQEDESADDDFVIGAPVADEEPPPPAEGGVDFVSDPGKFMAARTEHQREIDAQPARWWENWQDKINPEK